MSAERTIRTARIHDLRSNYVSTRSIRQLNNKIIKKPGFDLAMPPVHAKPRGIETAIKLLKQDNEKKGILGIQSLRNTQMSIILSATIAIALYTTMAALVNNTYNAAHLLKNFFGSQSSLLLLLKFSLISIILLFSFLCCSLALGYFSDSNFLLNLPSDFLPGYSLTVFDRGFVLAFFGNRTLCCVFPLLLWMLGPVPLAVSSVALVWLLYKLDFVEGKKEVLLL
ncbi:hypothetical protein NE237_010278 [Protea cynaroides]|uniref:Uncharacterized protein n=1 Tax=Protea cynaroides TaxID=273540 RepID=A0A9Q0R136_9MAGN|nr:hypothetical protein NE237_010278 [Protea cynaroides]